MRTPEEIATEVAATYHESLKYTVYSAAHEAISADREQTARRDKIIRDLANEISGHVGATLAAEQDGFISLSEVDKRNLTRAREDANAIYADLNDEGDDE